MAPLDWHWSGLEHVCEDNRLKPRLLMQHPYNYIFVQYCINSTTDSPQVHTANIKKFGNAAGSLLVWKLWICVLGFIHTTVPLHKSSLAPYKFYSY